MTYSIAEILRRFYMIPSYDLDHLCSEYINTTYSLERLTYENTNACKKFIKVDLTNPVIEVPCVYTKLVLKYLYDSNDSNDSNNPNSILYIPLYLGHSSYFEDKSSTTIFKRMCGLRNNLNLCKITNGKGVTYYGGRGILLDKNFTPLMMTCCLIDPASSNIVAPYILRLHSNVFTNTDLMSKALRNTLLKIIVSKVEDTEAPFTINGKKIKMIIDDLSDLIVSSQEPGIKFSSKDVEDFLEVNLEELLSNFVGCR